MWQGPEFCKPCSGIKPFHQEDVMNLNTKCQFKSSIFVKHQMIKKDKEKSLKVQPKCFKVSFAKILCNFISLPDLIT